MIEVLDAWQRVLQAEQQAAYGYALLGPRLPAAQQQRALDDQTLHEAGRDDAAAAVAALHGAPATPQGDYPQLYGRLAQPQLLAATLEDACAAAYRYLFAASATTAIRGRAQQGLTASAVRATRWRVAGGAGRAVTAFPGT